MNDEELRDIMRAEYRPPRINRDTPPEVSILTDENHEAEPEET